MKLRSTTDGYIECFVLGSWTRPTKAMIDGWTPKERQDYGKEVQKTLIATEDRIKVN